MVVTAYVAQRDDQDVGDLLNAVAEQTDKGGSRFPGMTYEDGIRAALDWLFGNVEDHPYEAE